MLTRWRSTLVGLFVLSLGLTLGTQAEAIYLFYMRKDLSHLIKKSPQDVVGKQVVVTDRLSVLWAEATERKTREGGKRYKIFDTQLFHCAIPEDSMGTHLESIWADAKKGYEDITKEIEAVNEQERTRAVSASQATEQRRELCWKLHRVWSNQPIVTLYGTVQRADFWGDVNGKSNGVATERVSIVVDKAEKPRKRWYRSLDEY